MFVGPFGSLAYSPDPVLQSTMCDYVMEKVFKESDEDDEPTTDEEASLYAEKFYNRRLILAGIVKLLMVSVFDINYGVPVVGQLVKVRYYRMSIIVHVYISYQEFIVHVVEKHFNFQT